MPVDGLTIDRGVQRHESKVMMSLCHRDRCSPMQSDFVFQRRLHIAALKNLWLDGPEKMRYWLYLDGCLQCRRGGNPGAGCDGPPRHDNTPALAMRLPALPCE